MRSAPWRSAPSSCWNARADALSPEVVPLLKVVSIVGTRPDALKMAPVILELARFPQQVRQTVIATGQHREMLQQVLDVFEIQPTHNLNVMLERQTLAQISARILERIDPLLRPAPVTSGNGSVPTSSTPR